MESNQKVDLIIEFSQSIFEMRYKLRRMFQSKLKEAGLDISFEVLEVIKMLQKQDGMNQQELADLLFKDKSNITYIIDNMVKADYVVRKEDETDRRNKRIFLKEKAHQLLEQLAPISQYCYLALTQDVTEPSIREGIEILAKINNSLNII